MSNVSSTGPLWYGPQPGSSEAVDVGRTPPGPKDEFCPKQAAISILIDNDVITPDVLRTMQKYAQKIEVDSDLGKQDWNRMASDLEGNRKLADEDMDAVRHFAAQCRSMHKKLHVAFRQSEYKDEEIDRKLQDVHLFLNAFSNTSQAYTEASARVAIQALAGADFGALATMAAYVAWAGHGPEELKTLVEMEKALLGHVSPLVTSGNKSTPVHREKLWLAKQQLLDEAIQKAKAGEPVEVDAQYFELTSRSFVAKLIEAAKAGARVRINIDPSRPRDGGDTGHEADDGPIKLRSLLQLANQPGLDIGVSIYPVYDRLGSLDFLMHRKIFRVGDKVLLSGMNANSGSGENVDAGVILEGPAARRLVEIFQNDVKQSTGATAEKIYGDTRLSAFLADPVTLSPHGLFALLDCLRGPSPPGETLPDDPTYAELKAKCASVNRRLEDLVEGGEDLETIIDKARSSKQPLPLKKAGRDLFANLVDRAISKTLTNENLNSLEDITYPNDAPRGTAEVALADAPMEREALMIQAISTAEKFVWVPAFVMTRPVARALIARRDEMRAQGKELDIRVAVDPGVYGYGSTPSEQGVLELEDAGIPVRWAVLPRTDEGHDRKVHAKQILTDKMEFLGSTNLSKKGMQDNWEVSGTTYFQPGDADSDAHLAESQAKFLKLWNRESLELNSKTMAQEMLADVDTPDREIRANEARSGAIRSILMQIRNFEIESAGWINEGTHDLITGALTRDYEKQGMARGYARLEALETVLGSERFYTELHNLPSYQRLIQLQNGQCPPPRAPEEGFLFAEG